MALFDLNELEKAMHLVHSQMLPTPQYSWPLLCEKTGTTIWVKHENHTPTGAFKIRGGITFIDWLRQSHPQVKGIITATRGNHGQSQARAATAAGMHTTIVVPKGNSVEKNAAMQAFGAEIIEFGHDFDEARIEALRLAKETNLFVVPAFHPKLVTGVATYAYELFNSVSDLDTVYAPIGCGSGVCGLITVRDLLNLKTNIVGVVSNTAPAVKLSFESGKLTETMTANTFADGMAVRQPVEEAFEIYVKGLERIVAVNDDEIAHAMRLYFQDTHNVAEGAGAAALAALLQEKNKMQHKSVGVILSGGNIDTSLFRTVLHGKTPQIEL